MRLIDSLLAHTFGSPWQPEDPHGNWNQKKFQSNVDQQNWRGPTICQQADQSPSHKATCKNRGGQPGRISVPVIESGTEPEQAKPKIKPYDYLKNMGKIHGHLRDVKKRTCEPGTKNPVQNCDDRNVNKCKDQKVNLRSEL